MLSNIFISVLNMSLVASYVTLFVLIARLILKKAPKIFSYALWAVVFIRLLCPFSFESAVGLLPSNTEPIPQNIIYQDTMYQDTMYQNTMYQNTSHQDTIYQDIKYQNTSYQNIPQNDTSVKLDNNKMAFTTPKSSVNSLQICTFIGSCIWLIGIAVMMIYSVVSLVKLRRKLIGATPFKKNIYIADHIDSPFVMGFIKPKIYLPSNLTASEREFIICHEQTHIKRLDYLTRIVSFVALSIHWFNPLVWIAFILSGKDMEISCDESVMKKTNKDIRADYCEALLKFATGKNSVVATPLAFCEGDTKSRVKSVMKYKKPMVLVSAICLVLVAIVSVAFLTQQNTISIFEAENSYIKETQIDKVRNITIKNNANFSSFDLDINNNRNFLGFVKNIEIKKYKVNSDRAETRDNTYQIELFEEENLLYTLNFNSDLSECWIDNGDKPSFSYSIKTSNEDILKILYKYEEKSNIDILYENRNDDQFGDNSKWLDIYYELVFPSSLTCGSMGFSTDGKNTLMFYFTENSNNYRELESRNYMFLKNAALMFSLVEDAQNVNFFTTKDDDIYGEFKYAREDVENIYGVLFPQTESKQGLNELMIKIFNDEYEIPTTYFENNSFTQAVEVSQKYVKDDRDSGIINYNEPIVENKFFQNQHKIFDVDLNNMIDVSEKNIYVVSYETKSDELL